MPDKISGSLGLCRKAGKLLMGFDTVIEAIQKGEAVLVLLAKDCSDARARMRCALKCLRSSCWH